MLSFLLLLLLLSSLWMSNGLITWRHATPSLMHCQHWSHLSRLVDLTRSRWFAMLSAKPLVQEFYMTCIPLYTYIIIHNHTSSYIIIHNHTYYTYIYITHIHTMHIHIIHIHIIHTYYNVYICTDIIIHIHIHTHIHTHIHIHIHVDIHSIHIHIIYAHIRILLYNYVYIYTFG